MSKPFLAIDSQILKIYSRGMKISNVPKYHDFLLRKNYYNSINVYGRLFLQTPSSDFYLNGSKFDEVMTLYHFDKKLRDLTFRKIMEVEANLRSTVSYHFCLAYPNETEAYVNTKSFNLLDRNGDICPSKIKSFSYIQKSIEKIFRNNYNRYSRSPQINSIAHYKRNHRKVPFWILVNYFDFGQLSTFIKLLDDSTQDAIASSFYQSISEDYNTSTYTFHRDEMNNVITALRELRNRVTHDNTLFFFRSSHNTKFNDFLHTPRGILDTDSRNTFFPAFIAIQSFISKDNFMNTQIEIENLIDDLTCELDTIPVSAVLNNLGFPSSWKF